MSKDNRHNHIDFIELPAANAAEVASGKAFYATVFGWQYQQWGDDYVDTQSSGVSSGINGDADHHPSAPLAVIYSDDLAAARSAVVEAGGAITKDIFTFPGGRRFHFKDPIGNELAVWSDK